MILCISDYWQSVFQNALGCAIGSFAAILVAIGIYYKQYSDNEKSKKKKDKEEQENILKYFSISVKNAIGLVEHQYKNNLDFISDFKKEPLMIPLISYVPLSEIKRIINNNSYDKIMLAYLDRFLKKNALNEFSEIMSILDYLYLELDMLPKNIENIKLYDHERKIKFKEYFNDIIKSIEQIIVHGNNDDPIKKRYYELYEIFQNNAKDIKSTYNNFITPINKYTLELLQQGNNNRDLEQLVIITRDCIQLYSEIIEHNEANISNDIIPISQSIFESLSKLKERSKSLIAIMN